MSKDIREMRKIIEGLFDDNEHSGTYEVCADCGGEGCESCEHGLIDVTGEFERPDFSEYEDLATEEHNELEAKLNQESIEGNNMDKDLYDLRKLAGLDNEEGIMSPFSSGDENVEEVREDDVEEDYLADPREAKPGKYDPVEENEFDDEDDHIIDVGDDEDFEEFDFQDEYKKSGYRFNEESDEFRDYYKAIGEDVGPGYEIYGNVIVDGVDYDNDEIANIPDQPLKYGKNWKYGGDQSFEESNILVVTKDGEHLDFGEEDGLNRFLAWRDGAIEEDLGNGYDEQHTADGQDYFPKGATSSPTRKAGPGGAKHGDNPMYTSVKVDEAVNDLHEKYVREYADYVKKNS